MMMSDEISLYELDQIKKVFNYYAAIYQHENPAEKMNTKISIENEFSKGKEEENEYERRHRKAFPEAPQILISVFHCKCALIELLNHEFSQKKIRKFLMDHCRWNFHIGGVNAQQFISLYKEILSQNPTINQNYISEVYHNFDPADKGWIEKNKFLDNIESIFPHFSHSNDLFSVLDMGSTNRVSSTKFHLIDLDCSLGHKTQFPVIDIGCERMSDHRFQVERDTRCLRYISLKVANQPS